MNTTEEYAFISCLLNKPELIDRVSSKIKPEYFEDDCCRVIYSKMLELASFNTPLLAKELKDVVSFKELLEIDSILNIVKPNIIDGYGYCILENYKNRQIKKLIESNNFDDMSSKIDDIRQITYFEEDDCDECEEYLKNVEERYNGEKDTRNIPTGFFNIDSQIDGFRKSELIIIGGRPASGKTTFGINLAYNMAKAKNKVLFCSLEMGKIELHERLVKSITKINNYKKMTPQDFEKIVKTSRAIKERLPLIIYDKAGMTIENIIYKAKQEKYDVIFIDHLSILRSSRNFKSRYEEVSYLSARLKVLARELDIPVVTLCQLNRALEGRDIKAPTMADLRDSGSCEQDADLVAFVYRPEYHLKDKEPDDKKSKAYDEWQNQMDELKGKAQLILAKNRRGYIGRFKFGFDGANYLFYERDD